MNRIKERPKISVSELSDKQKDRIRTLRRNGFTIDGIARQVMIPPVIVASLLGETYGTRVGEES